MKMEAMRIALQRFEFLVLIPFLILAFLLAGCAPKPTPTQSPEALVPTPIPPTQAPAAATEAPAQPASPAEAPADLGGVEWVLIEYGDTADPIVVEPGTRPTAVFGEGGTVSGSGGCNSFTTSYQVEGDKISFGPAASTRMACGTGMEQEAVYLAALEKAQTYQVVVKDRLIINYEGSSGISEQLVYDAQTPLVGTFWVLMSYGDPNNPTFAQPGVVTTAIFSADGMLNGSAGCNNYNTSYTVQEDRISIELPTSTLMACDTGMEQEQAYLAALGLAESYQVLGSILVITYASGSAQIRFSAQHMPLENIRWVLSSIDGQPLPVGVEAYAVFTPGKDNQDNQVSGSSGCNGFSGKYSVEEDKLAIPGPFGTTQMSCPEEVMQVEHSFLAALENSQSFETVLKQLTITTSNGLLIFTADRMPLEGPIWKLTALGPADNPQAPVSGADFTAIFSRQPGMPSGVMAGTTGCINSTNTYYANLKEIKLDPASRSDGTCSPELANQMESYFDGLNKAREYRILGSELQILYDDQVLKYTGTYPTGEGEAGPLTPLNGTIWRLVSIGATPAIPGSDTTAQISVNPDGLSGHISGSAGCNTYNALITGAFTVGPASVTQTVCDNPPGIMNQEGAYLSALGAATSFSLEGEQLRISTDQGLLVFTRQGPSAVQPLPPTETPEAVQPVPLPEAVISAPNAGNVDQVITFDGSGSTASTAIGAYLWDFGDGATGEGPVLDHTFTNAGTYTVTLTVTDANNQTGSTTLVVTIE